MTRRVVRGGRNSDPPAAERKRGGLFTGLFFGLIAGLVIAAALAWYFNRESGVFKAPEERIETVLPPPIAASPPPASKPRSEPVPSAKPPPVKPAPAPPPPRAVAPKPPTPAPPRPAPRVDYTFYGILPGEQPGKPATPPEKPPAPPRADDHWWLQVAALGNADDADKLKARLTLLGLRVTTQPIASGGLTLHRVRVGPYQREEDSFGDLDILAANDFEPRLLKDPSKP